MNIRIKRVDASLPLPKYETEGSAGFDLYSRSNITIEPDQTALLPSNLIIETPANHVLLLAARSSLHKKKGLILANAIGVIDSDYAGDDDEIQIMVKNVTKVSVTVEKGERIAQGIFMPIVKVNWQEVASMDNLSRGGIGSTGGYKDK